MSHLAEDKRFRWPEKTQEKGADVMIVDEPMPQVDIAQQVRTWIGEEMRYRQLREAFGG